MVASMEGRAIARPNHARVTVQGNLVMLLQWRAGQLPGQTSSPGRRPVVAKQLQWRAGQLPGQT